MSALFALLALAVGPSASAGNVVSPVDSETIPSTPFFTVTLASGEVHARVEVARDEAMRQVVGTCVPAAQAQGLGCRLAQPLAQGEHYWRLVYETPFCDGDAGQYCSYDTSIAGPLRVEVRGSAGTAVTPVIIDPVPSGPVDPPLIRPGRSIGGVALGMNEAEVRAAYGDPSAPARSIAARDRAAAAYAVHGGRLDVVYRDGVVVAISTTSRYYRTVSGVGVGTRPASGRAWKAFRATACGGLTAGDERSVTTLAVRAGAIVAVRIESAARPAACR
jgi:hypothetical protein